MACRSQKSIASRLTSLLALKVSLSLQKAPIQCTSEYASFSIGCVVVTVNPSPMSSSTEVLEMESCALPGREEFGVRLVQCSLELTRWQMKEKNSSGGLQVPQG